MVSLLGTGLRESWSRAGHVTRKTIAHGTLCRWLQSAFWAPRNPIGSPNAASRPLEIGYRTVCRALEMALRLKSDHRSPALGYVAGNRWTSQRAVCDPRQIGETWKRRRHDSYCNKKDELMGGLKEKFVEFWGHNTGQRGKTACKWELICAKYQVLIKNKDL